MSLKKGDKWIWNITQKIVSSDIGRRCKNSKWKSRKTKQGFQSR